MRLIAFDACLGAVSAAAGHMRDDGTWERCAADYRACTTGHAEALMPMLDRVVRDAGMDFRDCERVVATIGPGGFTGVRVGVAAARALVLATGAEARGLSTLDALALEARRRQPELAARAFAVIVDARRDTVFFALFTPGSDTAEPLLLPVAAAAQRIVGQAEVLVASGAGAVASHIPDTATKPEVALTDLQPVAATFAAFGLGSVYAPLTPLYLRPPDAKAQASFILPRAPT